MVAATEPEPVAAPTRLVHDLPDPEYRADPALSCSMAKRLLPPSCPAIFAWEREHGRPGKREFDHGHAAHQLVLGAGQPLWVLDAADWRRPATTALAKAKRAEGYIPLLRKDFRMVTEMAKALRRHPLVGALFNPDRGNAEVSLFWPDPETALPLKARLDWLMYGGHRPLVVDYKTADSALASAFGRAAGSYGYHQQHAWYCDGVSAVTGAADVGMVFVVQEKRPPYVVNVVEFTAEDVRTGRAKNRAAIEKYLECLAADEWPGYSDGIEPVSIPPWIDREYV